MITTQALFVWAIVFIAFFIRGISGFGSATIAIPLLVHFIPLTLAVPLLLIHDFLSTLATVSLDRTAVDKTEIVALLPFTMAGVVIGITLLINLPAAPLLGALGVVIIVFGVRALVSPVGTRTVSRIWAAPAGCIGGALGGAFGSGAATPCMIYLTHRIRDKTRVRATFSGYAIFDYAFRLVAFAVTGLMLEHELWNLTLATLPAMGIGLYAGNRCHGRISNEQALKVIGMLLVASGALLLWKAGR